MAAPMFRATAALPVISGLTNPASAAPIDFTQKLIGLDRKPMIECKAPSDDGKSCARTGDLTLGGVAAAGLVAPDRAASFDDQVRRTRLAQKVIDGTAVELSAADTKLIEDQVAKMGLSAVVAFGVAAAIDPAAAK